eukprot:5993341-Pyramimonas_sp.AAC.1
MKVRVRASTQMADASAMASVLVLRRVSAVLSRSIRSGLTLFASTLSPSERVTVATAFSFWSDRSPHGNDI